MTEVNYSRQERDMKLSSPAMRVALATALALVATASNAELLAIKRTADGSSIRLLDVKGQCKGSQLSAMMVLMPEGKTIEGCWIYNQDSDRFLIKWQGAMEPRAYGSEEFQVRSPVSTR